MVFHYPNGTPFNNNEAMKKKKQEKKKTVDFGKRGMDFEDEINQSNSYYLSRSIAVVHKKPTPVQIVKVDYPRRSAAVIKEAYFRQASTTDYNGVYKGLYLDFEAKETKNKTSFPFKNFHEHQIVHMEQCIAQQGVCFVLLWFSSLNRCFFFSGERLIHYWSEQQNGKKSLHLSTLESEGIEITLGLTPRVPYLEAVDTYIQAMKNETR
ncbi:Holliday junction resolvase RecU [uncultured Enterococcus sp.]|uniref:Holliday junction resolvase RecU n=1 Tax=uncultured Enterococcus sp. TaxID=167972 RepID=UPI002AA7E5C8|nr:Holliday junction resolvase RecU [uncultured Enterococcus sp.]